MKKQYSFDKNIGTFIINDTETGKNWYNQLWNEDGYVASITHLGNGESKYVNEDGTVVILNKQEEKYLYIRDEETKEYWNIGESPSMVSIDNYKCEHGQGYTSISSEYKDIKSSITFAVPHSGLCEVWKVVVKNNSNHIKNLSVFPLISFDLGGYEQLKYYSPETTSETMFIKDINGVFCYSQNPHQPEKRSSGFLASSEKVEYYDGFLKKFTGTAGNYARPYILEKGLNCTNSSVTVRERGAVLQNKIQLGAGEEKIVYYVAGFSENPHTVINEFSETINSVDELFKSCKEKGIESFGKLRVNTPNDRVNNIMNFWAEKQVSYCMIGKKAVRDNAQIAMGILNFDTQLAQKTIYECLCHQYSDGHAILSWSPKIEKTLYSDPSMWLILATCELIKETGDTEFLNAEIPYLDGEKATVYDHLKSAVKWLTTNLGPNKLPKIFYADWNDALNIPDENAESVFMAMGICWALQELAELSQYIKDNSYSKTLLTYKETLVETINKVAWNGDYYIRALSKFGNIGDKDNIKGGKIYLNPQTWSILSSVVKKENLEKVLNAIDDMENDYGTPLCKPAYKDYNPIVGRMSGMLVGVYENGGIYNHACGFKIMADCKVGRSENAIASLLKMIPDGYYTPSNLTTTEPYVFTNCYLMHESCKPTVGFSWKTGASAWALRGFYEGIMGLVRTYEGLKIKPSLPSEWKYSSVKRTFRECRYKIDYINNNEGCVNITVDGNKLTGDILPVFKDGLEHNVLVEL